MTPRRRLARGLVGLVLAVSALSTADAADPSAGLDAALLAEEPAVLVRDALAEGDVLRGALLFHGARLNCARCHVADVTRDRLGPSLAGRPEGLRDVDLVDGVLRPSSRIREGFESVTLVTATGETISGLLAEDGPDAIVVRDASRDFQERRVERSVVVARTATAASVMPSGLANLLSTRGEALDLFRFLIEIANQGEGRALELQAIASLVTPRGIPEYESDIDHAGLISDLDRESEKRGREIYARVCVNCHGTREAEGSLPTSLRFAEGKFKGGSDPYSMYRTLTHGFGVMAPQTWMVPREKYDVIHHIREAYLRPHNPSQWSAVDDAYLASLPVGTQRGPAPANIERWSQMDYGPFLINTYEIGEDGSNFAYKGIAVRLDAGPGGVARGNRFLVFDHDTMRVAAAWRGPGFIDYNGIHFNGRHNIHPRIVGEVELANPAGPGWGSPTTGSFDDPRPLGRDARPYGPLPSSWAKFRGLHSFGDRVVIEYTVGETRVRELPGLLVEADTELVLRTLEVGPHESELVLQVAEEPGAGLVRLAERGAVILGADASPTRDEDDTERRFDGSSFVELSSSDTLDLSGADYTIAARLRTREGGTIFAKTASGDAWVRDGKALFVRGGRLVFDIGWVGEVRSAREIADGKWHDVAMTWRESDARVELWIDGKLDASGALRPRGGEEGHVARIGFAAPDFPRPTSAFVGEIGELAFHARRLGESELAGSVEGERERGEEVSPARFRFDAAGQGVSRSDARRDARSDGNTEGEPVLGTWRAAGSAPSRSAQGEVLAGCLSAPASSSWRVEEGALRLALAPSATPQTFAVWTARVNSRETATRIAGSLGRQVAPITDLEKFTNGGPRRWRDAVKLPIVPGGGVGPFVVDSILHPERNPWSALFRATGLDFLPEGAGLVVSTWDGDVWTARPVEGKSLDDRGVVLEWRRFASGLFQPLGLKLIDDQIHVACRDQIVVLRDRNGDGEADHYDCFNSDHQVTDHFHEFAMGLQTDAIGNLYYTKGARHALKPLVPHHGTLLRVAKDGSRTDIIATGFRAPNGVCVNDDGSFFVTDQEGHWIPKNRLNWIREGRFYGNMWGYHDVTDPSDAAMEPPLAWITNSVDRSPGEMMWVPEGVWGELGGALLNVSYGTGKIFLVPHERVRSESRDDDVLQGGAIELPIPKFPTGTMRGRFRPGTEDLYLCGMFAWAGNQSQPGGVYRMRRVGGPPALPLSWKARAGRLEMRFSAPLDAAACAERDRYSVRVWGLERSARYGSRHVDEHALEIRSASVLEDGHTLRLEIDALAPTWSIAVGYRVARRDGGDAKGEIHGTIHALPELEAR